MTQRKIRYGREDLLQLSVVEYIRTAYPKVLFQSGVLSGMKMSIGQAVKAKKLGHNKGYPDLMIFHTNSKYSGLFIELKADPEKLYTQTGELRHSEHIDRQASIIDRLAEQGYFACFACTLEEAVRYIDRYMRTK